MTPDSDIVNGPTFPFNQSLIDLSAARLSRRCEGRESGGIVPGDCLPTAAYRPERRISSASPCGYASSPRRVWSVTGRVSSMPSRRIVSVIVSPTAFVSSTS